MVLQFEKYIVYVLVFFTVSSVFYKMIARNFLTSEFAIELSDKISSLIPHTVLILGLLGASIGISRSEVIQIDLLQRFLKARQQAVFQAVVYFFTGILLIIFFILAYQSRDLGDKNWIMFGYLPALSLLIIKSFIKVFTFK